MSEGILIALITGALAIPGAYFAAKASIKKADADLLGAVDARIQALITRLENEITALQTRLEESEERERRILRAFRRTLTILSRHDGAAVESIRKELNDVDL